MNNEGKKSNKGLFNIFDKFFTFFIGFLTYIGMGISTISKFLYTYFFKRLIFEIRILSKNIFKGFKLVLDIVFLVPKIIFNFIANIASSAVKKVNIYSNKAKEKTEKAPSKIKIYIQNKYDNLSVVKEHREKIAKELKVLQIDKSSTDAQRSDKKHTYQYLVRNQDGKLVKGYFSALSKLDTYSYLIDEGYEIYEIKTSQMIDFLHGESQYFTTKMRTKDLIFWLTQLSTYIKSGIPLTDSVKILANQNKKRKYKKIYDSIVYELTMGESFSDALKKQNNVFPGLLINMIKAAEMIGDIEGTLDDMANYYNDLEDTKKALVGAMTYPSIIFVFSLVVITFIMIYIIPQFVDVYSSSNIELNPLTQSVINISQFIQLQYFWILLFIVGSIIIYYVTYKNIKAFRTSMQFFFMHIPVIGKMIIYKEINLFSKTFAALNKNNILLTDSIEILSKITSNEIYKTLMYNTISNLLKGERMSDSFKNNWAVPSLAYYMIITGESTGELSTMLEKVSEYYQKEQKAIANTIKSFVEPIMIALLAVIVGVIILAILIPMFGLYTAIQ